MGHPRGENITNRKQSQTRKSLTVTPIFPQLILKTVSKSWMDVMGNSFFLKHFVNFLSMQEYANLAFVNRFTRENLYETLRGPVQKELSTCMLTFESAKQITRCQKELAQALPSARRWTWLWSLSILGAFVFFIKHMVSMQDKTNKEYFELSQIRNQECHGDMLVAPYYCNRLVPTNPAAQACLDICNRLTALANDQSSQHYVVFAGVSALLIFVLFKIKGLDLFCYGSYSNLSKEARKAYGNLKKESFWKKALMTNNEVRDSLRKMRSQALERNQIAKERLSEHFKLR